MSTTESNLIACAIKKLKQIAADEMADGVHISGRTAEAIDVVLAEIERLTRAGTARFACATACGATG